MDCKELDTTERLCTAQHLQMQSCAESGGPCEDTAICPGEGPQGSQVCQPFDPGLSDSRTTLLKLPSLWHSNSTSQLYTPSNYVPVLLELLMRVLEEVGVMTQQSQPGSQAKISLPFCLWTGKKSHAH